MVEDVELRSRFGFLALHGGSLERGTAEIATAAAEASGASLYAVRQPDDLRWHIPSNRCDPSESVGLQSFLDHVDQVVSIHGFGREHLWRALLVGGADDEMAARTGEVLRAALPGYRVVDARAEIPASLRGLHPDNPVNRTRGGGVQLELPPPVRRVPDRGALVTALASLA